MAGNAPRTSPGFQGSETSWAEVLVYSQGGDPVLAASHGAQEMAGRYRTDPTHTLINVSTNKALEAPGSWSATIKPSRAGRDSVLERIVDDDWVDIVYHRHGREWHTMRGLVTDVRRMRSVAGSGATAWSYVLTGQDFQRVFEVTPIWFNRFSRKIENAVGEIATKVFSGIPNLGGDPMEVVQGFLFGFFRELQGYGRATWKIPNLVPNTKGSFLEDVLDGWAAQGYSAVPNRKGVDPNFGNPSGNLWQLAKDWADPAFLELFCDLGKHAKQLGSDEELSINDSTISVFFRDKPFVLSPNLVDNMGVRPAASLGLGDKSAWFSLPLHIVPRQQIVQDDTGRSGAERINAFFVSPQVTQELIGAGSLDLTAPLWNIDDINLHGLRRYDIATRYIPDAGTLLGLTTLQRAMIRDWYALNPYFLNGTISLAIGRPEIRVGTRVRIPGESTVQEGDTSQDETYYVEQVSNSWSFGPGLKTQLGVTRGWAGDDASLVKAVTDQEGRYSTPAPGQAGGD
jgi:hypothetical protein